MSERFDFTGDELAPAYRAAVDAIEAGDLVVLPTDTVYGIAADAFKPDAVQRLLDAKGRGRDMPPPVLISVVESLDALGTDIPEAGRRLCEKFWPGPLTVICHAQGSLMWDLGETHGTVALRVPDHDNTRELLSRTGPLAVSSANLSGRPAAKDVYEAEEQLLDRVAVYLDGGEVTGGEPSTIVDLTGEIPHVVRLGALSLAQLREIVPEVTSDLDPAAPPTQPTDQTPLAPTSPSPQTPPTTGQPTEHAPSKPTEPLANEPHLEPTSSSPQAPAATGQPTGHAPGESTAPVAGEPDREPTGSSSEAPGVAGQPAGDGSGGSAERVSGEAGRSGESGEVGGSAEGAVGRAAEQRGAPEERVGAGGAGSDLGDEAASEEAGRSGDGASEMRDGGVPEGKTGGEPTKSGEAASKDGVGTTGDVRPAD